MLYRPANMTTVEVAVEIHPHQPPAGYATPLIMWLLHNSLTQEATDEVMQALELAGPSYHGPMVRRYPGGALWLPDAVTVFLRRIMPDDDV
jgi:hypothetical protein